MLFLAPVPAGWHEARRDLHVPLEHWEVICVSIKRGSVGWLVTDLGFSLAAALSLLEPLAVPQGPHHFPAPG